MEREFKLMKLCIVAIGICITLETALALLFALS